jgi:hypothetical protein
VSNVSIAPNAKVAQDFVEWWFAASMFGRVEIGWIDRSTEVLNRFRLFALGDPSVGEYAAAINAVPGQSVYFRPATVNPGRVGRTSDADFVEAPGVWLDQDEPAQVAQGDAISTSVRPHSWIITGRHPHLRRQGYIRLAQPLIDPGRVRSLNVRFREVYGGDGAVVNPTSLMRVPGTIAWPRKPGRIAEVTEWVVAATPGDRTYTVEEVSGALTVDRAHEQPARHLEHDKFNHSPQTRAAGPVVPLTRGGGGHWHSDMVGLTARQVVQGMTDEEILAQAAGLTMPGFTVAQTVREIQSAIDGARRKWGIPSMSRLEQAQAQFDSEPTPSARSEEVGGDVE